MSLRTSCILFLGALSRNTGAPPLVRVASDIGRTIGAISASDFTPLVRGPPSLGGRRVATT
eukprot:2118319-Pyramimonas_sp.AAC.1